MQLAPEILLCERIGQTKLAFKLFRREVLRQVHPESEGSFIDAELLLETRRAGFRIAEMGLNYYPRVAGTSTLASSSVVLKLLREMLRYGWNTPARRRTPTAASLSDRQRG